MDNKINENRVINTAVTPQGVNDQRNESRIQKLREIIQGRREKATKNGSEQQPLDLKEFQIGLKIGQGAFAIVRRAVHKDTKAIVAIKTYEKKSLKEIEA